MMSSASFVALALMFALMAQRLIDTYLGGHYVCPGCGARREGRHAANCHWR
jgi:hypothetical protein